MNIVITPEKIITFLLLLFVGIADANAVSRAWLIGGGNHIENSQGQIEQNVIWLERLLKNRVDSINTYYAAGNSNEKDVVFWEHPEKSLNELTPLANVFTPILTHGKQYKERDLLFIQGGTDKKLLFSSLENDFKTLNSNEDVLLVYNGHGGLYEKDTNKNYLMLWGRQKATVSEINTLLDSTPKSSTVRFVFTQCYSGGFNNLIYEDPYKKKLSTQSRCGFFAESAFRQSEGCDLGVNKEEFRDYTTYFFAALSGESRLGEPLHSSPDRNNDGKTSFREAHLYTLLHAKSNDLSRSTSEAYLEQWQPWFLRWDTALKNEESVYWDIAKKIAEHFDWPLKTKSLLKQQRLIEASIEVKRDQLTKLSTLIEDLQSNIQYSLRKQWPELFNPYTYSYHKVIENNLDEIREKIINNSHYPKLIELQNEYLALQQGILDRERTHTQVQKILRLKKLARLEAQFERYADKQKKEERNQILACEDGHI